MLSVLRKRGAFSSSAGEKRIRFGAEPQGGNDGNHDLSKHALLAPATTQAKVVGIVETVVVQASLHSSFSPCAAVSVVSAGCLVASAASLTV